MKKTVLITTALSSLFLTASAQWTPSGDNIYNTSQGKVSVGTLNFPAKLTVFENTNLGSAVKNTTLLSSISGNVGSYNNFQQNTWLVRNAAGNNWTTARLHDGLSIDVSFLSPQTDTRTWWERDPQQDIQSWGTSGNTYMALNAGKLGIGTPTPSGMLSLGGSVITKKLFIYDDGTDVTGFGQNVAEFRIFGAASGTNHISFGKYQLSGDSFSEQMRIDINGNVSIGTTDAKGYKLAVNGSMIATEIKVKPYANWPDYVFKPAYKLPKLSEVKAYIDANQHLPEIPSEAEIKKSGINLGEVNTSLLKKVEELTLYMIEKDKQMEEQKQVNLSLQKQLDLITQKLNKLSNKH